MGLFGGNDDNEDDRSRRGGFKEVDTLSLRGKERVIDKEAEVVIYGIDSAGERSLTAVPLKDTALELPEDPEVTEE